MEITDILFSYVKQNSSFNAEEIKTICSYFKPENLGKEEVLLQKGSWHYKLICNWIVCKFWKIANVLVN